MTLSKDDERWLACLDRAIALRPDADHLTIVSMAQKFYEALKRRNTR